MHFMLQILLNLSAFISRLWRARRHVIYACVVFAATLIVPASASALTRIIRVDAQNGLANPSGTPGDSWSNAYKYLQNAIAQAIFLDPSQANPVEIRVRGATGAGLIYRTDENATNQSGTDQRTDTFTLRQFVNIFGQYIGGTGGNADTRDPAYITILSGEIQTSAITDNAIHVVTASSSAITAEHRRLEGFTIRDAYSEIGGGAGGDGGGIRITNGADPRIDRCTIKANHAVQGAGMFIMGSSPVITNSIIENNVGLDGPSNGGGVFLREDSLNNADTDAKFITTIIRGNTANKGGGVMCKNYFDQDFTLVTLINCLLHDNEVVQYPGLQASGLGGGILIEGAFIHGSAGHMINCTIADNNAWRGGGVYVRLNGEDDPSLLQNSIVWGNNASDNSGAAGHEIYLKDSDLHATNNDVRNRLDGDYVVGAINWVSGNIGETPSIHNPHFVNTGAGNYHLVCTSLAVNRGNNSFVPCDQYDVNGAGANCSGGSPEPTPDLDLATRIVGTVDMGAYEQALTMCQGDADHDCDVDVDDLIMVILNWACTGITCDGDVDSICGNGTVDVDDLIAVILNWASPCTGCIPTGTGLGADPESYEDCENICDELEGEAWFQCMQACFMELCNKGHSEFCD
jgi:hypothetical protein